MNAAAGLACAVLTQERLNVIQAGGDRRLEHVRATVGNEALVDDLAGLRRQLDAYAGCPDATARDHLLDLLGHAGAMSGILVLGGTAIDPMQDEVRQQLLAIAASGVLAKLRVQAVRLIGCNTGLDQARLGVLHDLLGVPVFGTFARIYALNFDAGGLAPHYDVLLRDQDGHGLTRPSSAPLGLVTAGADGDPVEVPFDPAELAVDWLNGGPRPGTPVVRLRDLERLLAVLDLSDGRCFRGLLTLPFRDLLVPLVSRDAWSRAEVLFDRAMVCFYTEGQPEGVCFRVRDPHRLIELIAGA